VPQRPGLFRRRRSGALPADVEAGLALACGERVLAAAPVTGGGWVVATDQAMHTAGLRLPWSCVVHAAWERADDILVVETVAAEPGVPAATRRLPLDEPGSVPAVVRERVMDSIVVTERVQLTGAAGVRVVARRVPGSAELAWQLVLDEGLDPLDPQVRAGAQAALDSVRASSGL
jgi:hypothetical protein